MTNNRMFIIWVFCKRINTLKYITRKGILFYMAY